MGLPNHIEHTGEGDEELPGEKGRLDERTERYAEIVGMEKVCQYCCEAESELQMIRDTVLDLLDLIDKNLIVKPPRGPKVTYQCFTKVESELHTICDMIRLMDKNHIAQAPRGDPNVPRAYCTLQEICDVILGTVLGLLDKTKEERRPGSQVSYRYCVETELWKVCDTIIGLMDKNPIAKVPTGEYSVRKRRKLKAKEYVQGLEARGDGGGGAAQ